ncbi:hypothetical protein CMV_008651 [Castanea mollissima]|uniref:DUF641 domain-containing protein n=1 Tax=Castanea mollissima TaxID=60419 RepID=A0A8J4W1X6_9ROSI|nr:hypothetical protein CMV_008651 [Castanea mollissima]
MFLFAQILVIFKMDPVKPSAVTPAKSKLARTFAKVLHLRAATGVAPVDGNHKVKPQQKVKEDRHGHVANVKVMTASHSLSQSFEKGEEVENNKVALEALLATLFASVSSIKAAYAQLQHAQSPYDPYGIQSADQLVVSELKSLSELKHSYLKKQFNPSPSPETAMVMAEIQELKSVLKTYEIMGKKLESQVRLKDSEIVFLREKLEEAINQNRLLEKRLNQSGQLSVLDNLHKSGLNPSHFMTVLRHTVKSIRIFVRLILDEMKVAKMDIDGIANAMEPCVVYWKDDHKCFAFESYVCKVMFSHFGYPNFSEPDDEHEKLDRELFFGQFMELKSVKPKEFLTLKPNSEFAKFCRNSRQGVSIFRSVHGMARSIYLQLQIKMETAWTVALGTAFWIFTLYLYVRKLNRNRQLSPVCLHRVELLLETTNVVRDQPDAENAPSASLWICFVNLLPGILLTWVAKLILFL